MNRPSNGWVIASVLVAGVFASALPSCGSSGQPTTFDPDSGSSRDGTAPRDSTAPFDVNLNADTGPVTRNDFPNPVYDTGVPKSAGTVFASPDVDGGADAGGGPGPCLFEPEIGSLFPNNWLRPRFRWNAPAAQNLFEITLVIPHEKSPLVIYTAASGYKLDPAAWTLITSYGVGTIHLSVRSAVVSATGTLMAGPFAGSEGDIEVAPVQATGTVVYWTTSSGTVLKGFAIGDESVQPVITPAQVGMACVACHTSTPDGKYVALTVAPGGDGSGPASLDVRSVDGKATQPPYLTANAIALLARTNQHAPTFSLGHWSTSDRTMLSMFYDTSGNDQIMWTDLQATTQTQGTSWGYLARNGDPNMANSAAWSHDGTKVAYVSTTGAGGGAGVIETDGQIWTVPYNARAGGTATPVTGANDPSYTQFYPIFSADDAYIAFDRVPTGSTSYNDPAAEIYAIPSGGGTPTRLSANDPPACLGVTSPGVTNSWPKWSPLAAKSNGSTYYFLIFSSTRDAIAMGPQLYVTAVVVTGSTVKTYNSLYLWNQPETEHNHTPAWDVFALPPPPPPP